MPLDPNVARAAARALQAEVAPASIGAIAPSSPQRPTPMQVGRSVRAALQGRSPPLLAIETTYSFLRGSVTPEDWGAALAGLCGATDVRVPPERRGANNPAPSELAATIALQAGAFSRATQVPPPAPIYRADGAVEASHPWAALADLGDLAGLPACIEQFGRRVAVGATVPLQREPRGPASLTLCLAPEHAGYRALCRFLSWRNEHATSWEAWQAGLTYDAPSMDGLVVLVANAVWGDLFAWHGAEVYTWMMGPGPMPSGYPPVFVPHLTDLQRGNERAHQLRAMIQERSQVRLHIDAARVQRAAVYLSDLPALMDAMGEYDEASERGRVLLRRCTYTPGTPSADGHTPWHLPPPQCADPNAELRQRCMEGIRQRYGGNEPAAVRARLAYELDIFTKKGFAVYILAVWNLTRHRQTCGRGSAASSLVCYALGITNVDPLKYHLVFERFMSEERFDPPDIDVDFAHDERDAVLQETIATFGRDHVALVSTHQTLHAQGAWRQAANVLGKERAATTAAQRELTLKRQFAVGSGPGEDWEAVQDAADALLGTPTHFGVHCGGIIITRDPIREMVPIHPAAKQLNGMPAPAIAWEKDGAEQLGLVKIDFLGNRSLGVVRDVLADLRDDGVSINEWKWEPEEDLLARQIISRGLTIGCFYIESPAMRLLNAKAGVTDFDRLTLHSSIIRPAANSWINTYLERFTEFRKTGQQRDEWYPHPALRALLSESFGILSYQEDLMLISRDLAGFSIKQQNQLRKALGRSDTPQRLASLKGDFLAGCEAHAVSRDVTALVWDMIVSFAGYSFTKAHSASYVKVSFQAACLKVHNPAHFMARVISNGGGFYGPCAYVEEARRRKVEILSPCVVVGEWETKRASHHALRIGFQLLRGVRRSTIARIMRQRERRPFVGACDLWRRCHPSPSEMEALLWSGALDALLAHITPAQRYWLIAYALQQPRSTDHGEPDQLEFDFAADTKVDPIPPSDLSPLCQRTLDRHAWNALGVLPRAHPFALWDLPMQRPWRCADVQPAMKGRTVTVMAWVVTSKAVIATQLRGRDGSALASPSIRPMAFVTLEDECGIAESVWFPETYQRYGPVIDAGIPFQVTGRIQVEYGVATLEVHRIDSHFRDLHT